MATNSTNVLPNPQGQGESSSSTSFRKKSADEFRVTDASGLWVFGYGSLCWNQGFAYTASMIGFIQGYSRRFWQGNTTHRGSESKPGRVATLVEDCEGIVWGQAFQVQGEAALPYLNQRECELGGYCTSLVEFHSRYGTIKPFPVIVYISTPNNPHWLGDGSLTEIAEQILTSSGPSGHNVEYLLRLADFVREETPEARDEHLFALEAIVREQITSRNLCLRTLMGDAPEEANKMILLDENPDGQVEGDRESNTELNQFSKRVPSKQLRCVKI